MENDEIFGTELNHARETATNWSSFIKEVGDGYKIHAPLAHVVQKDAIQNSYDAKQDEEKWQFVFEIMARKKHNYLTVRDTGTTGLTGRILNQEDLEKDLPENER